MKTKAPQNCSATGKFRFTKPVASASDIFEENFDWREHNKVTHVKNQGSCGSCWTFSTVASLESHYSIHKLEDDHEHVLFSEQQLVDCAGDYDNNGCYGGLPSHAFEYIRYNGLALGETYPYTASDDECYYDEAEMRVANVEGGSFNITEGDEDQLVQSIKEVGPVAVSFQVAGHFMSYRSGVYTNDNCGTTT